MCVSWREVASTDNGHCVVQPIWFYVLTLYRVQYSVQQDSNFEITSNIFFMRGALHIASRPATPSSTRFISSVVKTPSRRSRFAVEMDWICCK